MSPEFKEIDLHELKESKLNPRHHFDPTAMAELTASVALDGILEPLLVRKASGGGFEIIAGSRRYRAAKGAGLVTVPCIILEKNDQEALEAMLTENLQRANMHPLEEAEGYKHLMAMAGKGARKMDVAAIAAKMGLTVSYIYDRVKLCVLIPEAKDLFLADAFTAGHAIQIARLKPEDQARCVGTRKAHYADGGLFTKQKLLFAAEDLEPGGAIGTEADVKPVSVRELKAWIDEHVKFDHRAAELQLFPQTVETVRAANENAEKIIQITHNFSVDPEAKDGTERIYGPRSWTRADGKHGCKTCPSAITGVVVVGPDRSNAFKVCIDKKGCKVHYAAEIKETEKRVKAAASGTPEKDTAVDRRNLEEQKWRHQKEQQAADRQRWEQALPAILEAMAGAVKKAPTKAGGLLGKIILEALTPYSPGKGSTLVAAGTTADDLIRRAAYLVLYSEASNYNALQDFPKLAKAFGVDVKKILDQAAPLARGHDTGQKKGPRHPGMTCVKCGCTDQAACVGGCGWAQTMPKKDQGICSRCDTAKEKKAPAPAKAKNGSKKKAA